MKYRMEVTATDDDGKEYRLGYEAPFNFKAEDAASIGVALVRSVNAAASEPDEYDKMCVPLSPNS